METLLSVCLYFSAPVCIYLNLCVVEIFKTHKKDLVMNPRYPHTPVVLTQGQSRFCLIFFFFSPLLEIAIWRPNVFILLFLLLQAVRRVNLLEISGFHGIY